MSQPKESNKLPKVYSVVGIEAKNCRHAGIAIQRRPSQMPDHLYSAIMLLDGGVFGHSNPDTGIMFEFLAPENLSDAEDILREAGWRKENKK